MSNTTFNPRTVGALTTALEVNPLNIISNRNPTVHDNGILGQVWINKLTNSIFQLTSYSAGSAVWTSTPTSGMNPTFQTVTITGIAGTSLNVESGNAIFAGNVTVDGTTTLNGPFVLSDDTQIVLRSTYNGVGALQLLTDGGTSETLVIQSQLGTSATSVNVSSTSGGITLNAPAYSGVGITLETGAGEILVDSTGGLVLQSSEADPAAVTISAQDTAGGIRMSAGTQGIQETATGALTFTSSFAGPAILFTSSAGSMTFTADSRLEMSGAAGAGDALTLSAPGIGGGMIVAVDTGGITMQAANGPVSITSGTGNIAIGTDSTTGTIRIGGTGNNTGALSIAPGTGAQTVNIATDGTSAKLVNIGTGANSNIVNIGSVLGTSAVFIGAGSGGIDLEAAGNVEMAPATGTAASPTATVTINSRVGSATFTGFTTAGAGGTQLFTINNLLVTTTSAIFATVTHLNASTNGALLVLIDVTQNTGHILLSVQNLGTNPLGAGDNVRINFWVIS